MSQLQKALESGQFAITAEMAPPKGYDFSEQIEVVGESQYAQGNKQKHYQHDDIFCQRLSGNFFPVSRIHLFHSDLSFPG